MSKLLSPNFLSGTTTLPQSVKAEHLFQATNTLNSLDVLKARDNWDWLAFRILLCSRWLGKQPSWWKSKRHGLSRPKGSTPWSMASLPSVFMLMVLGRAPLTGIHSGRLAVEQLYGYMVRNAKTLGIISTLKGWCFLYRQDGGILVMTRMFGDFLPWDGVTNGAPAEGYYYPAPNWTIMKALYFMSRLGEIMADTVETTNGQPGTVNIPYADPKQSEAAPRIRIVRDLRDRRLEPRPADDYYYGGYQAAHAAVGMLQFHEGVDYTSLLFEPWKVENQLGPKNWIAQVISDQSKVVLKLWDGWKVDTEERDREAEVYVHLRPLWGKYVPSLRVATPFDYMHALIIEYIDVNPSSSLCWLKASPVSTANLTERVEAEIFKAFDAIHELGVCHNDIRAENILVTAGGESVFIIDFAFSEIFTELTAKSREYLSTETDFIKELLDELKHPRETYGMLRKADCSIAGSMAGLNVASNWA
jgi:hypothetical protein